MVRILISELTKYHCQSHMFSETRMFLLTWFYSREQHHDHNQINNGNRTELSIVKPNIIRVILNHKYNFRPNFISEIIEFSCSNTGFFSLYKYIIIFCLLFTRMSHPRKPSYRLSDLRNKRPLFDFFCFFFFAWLMQFFTVKRAYHAFCINTKETWNAKLNVTRITTT